MAGATPGLDREAELERLRAGDGADAPPPPLERFEIDVASDSDVAEVLERARDVLMVVVTRSIETWPTLEEWRGQLPDWFVSACAPEGHADAEADDEEDDAPWELSEFLYWFEPPQREWWWWGCEVRSPVDGRIFLAIDEPSAARDALEWLLGAAGATEVVDENLRELRELG